MSVLVTGADRPLGKLAAAHLEKTRAVRRFDGGDLRKPEAMAALVQGAQAVLHLDAYNPQPVGGEQERLDIAAQGTYVLMREAREAGVERVVLASSLALFDAYPEDYVLDEAWQPEPDADAASLSPYLAELTCREFARQGGIAAICLRFGALGKDVSETQALAAIDGALALPLAPHGYRWHVFHISSDARFPIRAARQLPGFAKEKT